MLAPRPITQRFLDELARAPLPERISLQGHPTSCAVATALIKEHAPTTILAASNDTANDARIITCMSMESFGTTMLAAFLVEPDVLDVDGRGEETQRAVSRTRAPSEKRELPKHILLWSVPEEQLDEYAREHNIPLAPWPTSDVRTMLDRIAQKQPQTYHSLSRSMIRLQPQLLRVFDAKQDKA